MFLIKKNIYVSKRTKFLSFKKWKNILGFGIGSIIQLPLKGSFPTPRKSLLFISPQMPHNKAHIAPFHKKPPHPPNGKWKRNFAVITLKSQWSVG